MKASIDIENSKLKDVVTFELKVIEYIENKIIKFDISNLNTNNLEILKKAISNDLKYNYTDIEMFFINNSDIPEFGPDYDFYIKDNKLIGIYIKNS